MRDNLAQCGGSAAEPGIAGEAAEATGKVGEEKGCPGPAQWVSERLKSLPKVPSRNWSWNSKQEVCAVAWGLGVGLRMTGGTHPCLLRLAPHHQHIGPTEQRSSLASSSHLSATTSTRSPLVLTGATGACGSWQVLPQLHSLAPELSIKSSRMIFVKLSSKASLSCSQAFFAPH